MDFSKFDQKVDMDKINQQKAEAAENSKNFDPVPAGEYIAKIENLELAETKDGRPMFKACLRLVEAFSNDGEEAKYLSRFNRKKPCVFMNRVIFGTKNDGAMIQSVETWLSKLFPNDDPVVFTGYADFAQEVMDIAEDADGMEVHIDYDDSKFNSIVIIEVY
ncbi:MAG: hypothetical protein MJ000_11115 [Bacteroidales bacterium]|nr:hypothetical protein [Bacteroidales bacterium]